MKKATYFFKQQGDARILREELLPESRGTIVDRQGELLAFSSPIKVIWAEPDKVLAGDENLQALAHALGMSLKRLHAKLASNRNFVYLHRSLTPKQAEEVIALGIDGVHAKTEFKRFYPAGEVASHLVGLTDVDDRGQEGMELAYNELLTGVDGSRKVMKNRRGELIKHIKLTKAPSRAGTLALSIDINLQYAAYKELKAAVANYKAASGSIVILDVDSGEILAMVNQPSYNSNNRARINPLHMRNSALIDLYEPGSTVKPFTIAAALESGRYSAKSVIDTAPGYMAVNEKLLEDPRNYGELDLETILSKSSQIGITKIALDLDMQDLRGLFDRVGLGEFSATGYPGEQPGYLPNQKVWRDIDRATLSFGHGLTVNTLQLASAYAVIANDGVKRPVSLLKQSGDSVEQPERVFSAKVAQQVRQMMTAVTEKGGTGTAAKISGYSVAGKTGTAHKVSLAGYDANRYRATFAGMAPANNPKLVAVVTIDDPGGEKYFGGEIAAPVFARVMKSALRLKNVSPDRVYELSREDDARSQRAGDHVSIKETNQHGST